MHQLDDEMKRTDELLYQMIPKSVADRLRKGEPAVNTCEVSPCHLSRIVSHVKSHNVSTSCRGSFLYELSPFV